MMVMVLFNLSNLPNEAQIATILDFEIFDINDDGFKDVIGMGNLYDAEVETVCYDTSQGYVLVGNSNGSFNIANNLGLISRTDMRTFSRITINQEDYIIIANNNDDLTKFKCL